MKRPAPITCRLCGMARPALTLPGTPERHHLGCLLAPHRLRDHNRQLPSHRPRRRQHRP
ncbi:hypothetical protein [Deinococcus wulumuqiensis]|uniref:hypothetical protein n=1 Tax=Deinococcus wulumuqiensis TaxID=980427 RepID=UPI00242D1461|nr:hypothetical protein [Deinococcus wulumuqiensis]